MAGYYRNFIPNFSGIAAPISDLLKGKPKKIRWNDQAEHAFRTLKECLMSEPVLANPDWTKEFKIQTDASDLAIAGILTQEVDGKEHIIAYFSRKLKSCEKKYAATEKEGLAALEAIEHFRTYVEGSHFDLITDCSAVTYIRDSKWRPSSRLSRWSVLLQGYSMTIKHRKGRENIVCDTLSRAVCAIFVDSSSAWYNGLKQKVNDSPENYPNFKIENEDLYKFVEARSDLVGNRFEWRLVVPPDKVTQLVEEQHAQLMHLGTDKTLDRMKLKYYWPKMKADVKRILSKCATCKQSKYSTIATVPPMGQHKNATRPFQMIALDFLSGFVRSKSGNTDLLVCLDVFSKFVRLFPVKRISVDTLTVLIENEWFLKYGSPQVLISDNAVTFLGNKFQDLLQKYHVHHFKNSRRHCQNNPVERVNRVILACTRTYCQDDHRVWDSRISEIEFAINNTKHFSTGFTPFFLSHGFESILDGRDHHEDSQDSDSSVDRFVQQREAILGPLYRKVIENNRKQFEKYKKSYDSKHKKIPPAFEIGQKVYKKNYRISSAIDHYAAKLGPVYVPCKIVAKKGATTYELEDQEGRNIGLFAAQDLIPE